MATVLLPRSLLALFPGVDRRHMVGGDSVGAVIEALDLTVPGLRDRLVDSGPRLRPHINVFVDGAPADLASPVGAEAVIHVIPAVSGGCRVPSHQPGDSFPLTWTILSPGQRRRPHRRADVLSCRRP